MRCCLKTRSGHTETSNKVTSTEGPILMIESLETVSVRPHTSLTNQRRGRQSSQTARGGSDSAGQLFAPAAQVNMSLQWQL